MTDQDTQAHFYPFHTINEFMRPDYRLAVVRAALNALPELDERLRKPLERLTRQVVKVPGFRNPEKAPNAIKVLPMAKAFEKSPELVAAILAAWAESCADLRQKVYALLQARGWKMFPETITLETLSPNLLQEWAVLPLTADRTRLPGFVSLWPQGNDFEDIYKHFTQTYPEMDEGIDNVSLMVVWLSMRLPIDVEGKQQEANEDAGNPESASGQTGE